MSFEVRIKIADLSGRCALLVRGNMLRQHNRRVLIPFGGGLTATRVEVESYADVISPVQVGQDLRFRADESDFRSIMRLLNNITPERILAEARREFFEEAVQERSLLADVSSTDWRYLKKLSFIKQSVRSQTWGQPTLYCIGVVEALLSEQNLNTLLQAERSSPAPLLEFVPPSLFSHPRDVYTPYGSCLPPIYGYLT